MRGWAAAALGTVAIVLVACGGGDKKPPAGPAHTVEPAATPDAAPAPVGPALVFDVEPDDAEIFVDGEGFGFASDVEANGAMPVESGLHQIIITRDGYQTWRAEVSVQDGPETIRVRLDETTDAP